MTFIRCQGEDTYFRTRAELSVELLELQLLDHVCIEVNSCRFLIMLKLMTIYPFSKNSDYKAHSFIRVESCRLVPSATHSGNEAISRQDLVTQSFLVANEDRGVKINQAFESPTVPPILSGFNCPKF